MRRKRNLEPATQELAARASKTPRQNLEVALLVALAGGKAELAHRAGVDPSQVSRWLLGSAPRRGALERLAAAAGVPLPRVLEFAEEMGRYQAVALDTKPPQEDLHAAITRRFQEGVEEDLSALSVFLDHGLGPRAPSARDRDTAPALWAKLEALEPKERLSLGASLPSLHSWALVELLCERSSRRAVHNAEEAVQLAHLAVLLAKRVPGPPRWRERVGALAQAFLGNAFRVRGDLPSAERTLPVARRTFEACDGADPEGLLNASRPLDLEASLRRGQRRFREALALLDRALELAPTTAARVRLQFSRATTFDQWGLRDEAVAVLRETLSSLDEAAEPRCAFGLRFNLAANLLELGRLSEAEELRSGVVERAQALGNDHDLVRIEWLEARFQAARGDLLDAIARLDRVRLAFIARGMSYDTALAALELAAFYLETHDPQNVAKARALASDVAPIFKAQGVQREALAAVRLFVETARRGSLTEGVVRSALSALRVGRG